MLNNIIDLKKEIENYFNIGDLDKAKEIIIKNECIISNSIYYFILKSKYYYLKKDYIKAISLLEEGLIYSPYNIDINYNLVLNNMSIKNFDKCAEHIFNLLKVMSYFKDNNIEYYINNILYYIDFINLDNIEKGYFFNIYNETLKKLTEFLKLDNYKSFPKKNENSVYSNEIIFQKNRKYYTGLFERGLSSLYNIAYYTPACLISTACFEIFEIDYIGKNYSINFDEDYILPIIFTTKKIKNLYIKTDNKSYNILNRFFGIYDYYKFNGNVNISADEDFYVGKPIKLEKKENNKDLVLTIFVDGLSNEFLKNYNLEEIMPNTYKFFKDGIICNESYSTGEWTLPSVASLCTGLYTNRHHLYHPDRNDSISDNVETIFEIFENNGYNTCFINSDWRITPLYGYLKGVNRYLYSRAISTTDFNILDNSINHLETFKKTNNYMFLSFMDLHSISEYEAMDIFSQTNMTLEEKENFIVDSEKSVNKEYSLGQVSAYKYKLKKLDTTLNVLYNYLQDNYDLDNCTITLTSDHGQSFLEKDKVISLNGNRIEVPLMIRSKELFSNVCNEIIQTTDYLNIITKLANININLEDRDSILPKFLGGKGREYSYSESIYPNETYKACINTLTHLVHFESKETINEEGMVSLDEYTFHIYDKNTKTYIEDCNIKEKCLNIIYEHMKYLRIH